ncbi:hypothetical protein NPIL_67751, partial [Nephila pilipes]
TSFFTSSRSPGHFDFYKKPITYCVVVVEHTMYCEKVASRKSDVLVTFSEGKMRGFHGNGMQRRAKPTSRRDCLEE